MCDKLHNFGMISVIDRSLPWLLQLSTMHVTNTAYQFHERFWWAIYMACNLYIQEKDLCW
jgi:hypothetical protein